MKKVLIGLTVALILGLFLTASAADSSSFQNTSPWFVKYWNNITSSVSTAVQSGVSSMSQWFQNFSRSAVNPQQSQPAAQQPLNQYPAVTMPNQQSQSQSGGSQQGGGENGSQGSPYKLEPNQFKKMCSQNTYVLYWRKGGKQGRDMAQPAGGAGAGKDQGAKDYWQLPTCEELAKCHCCCNTCTFRQGKICPQGWCFSKNTICDDKKDCSNKCSDKCDEKCKKGCEDYKEPTHDKDFNRDCKCSVEGCPASNSKDCKIIIRDPGLTQIEYTKKDGNPEQYFENGQQDYAMFENGNGPSDDKSKIIAQPSDKADKGYVKKLKDEKGVCCKCYQDGPPIN